MHTHTMYVYVYVYIYVTYNSHETLGQDELILMANLAQYTQTSWIGFMLCHPL